MHEARTAGVTGSRRRAPLFIHHRESTVANSFQRGNGRKLQVCPVGLGPAMFRKRAAHARRTDGGAAEPPTNLIRVGRNPTTDQRQCVAGPEAKLKSWPRFRMDRRPGLGSARRRLLPFSDIPATRSTSGRKTPAFDLHAPPVTPEPSPVGEREPTACSTRRAGNVRRRPPRHPADDERSCIKTVLASSYQGKRLNSPNDAVFAATATCTSPTCRMAAAAASRFASRAGLVRRVPREARRPDHAADRPDDASQRHAFSPEKTLYVAQSDPAAAIWRAFDVRTDGTLGDSRVL